MRLADAMKAAEADHGETPIPINAGRCEHRMLGGGYCGARARWWFRNQFRCNKHKETP